MNIMSLTRLSALGVALFIGANSLCAAYSSTQTDRLERLLEERTPQERAHLTERLKKLRRLGPEERRALLDRARSLHEMEKRAHKVAPDDLRRRLRADPQKAPLVWRHHFESELRSHGRRQVEKLPPEVRRRLRNATPEERQRILRRVQSKHMDLKRLGRTLNLDPAEIKRIEGLGAKERSAAYLGLRRQLIEFVVKRDGLPKGLTLKEWKRLRSLPDIEFFRALRERGFDARDFHRRSGPPLRPKGAPRRR